MKRSRRSSVRGTRKHDRRKTPRHQHRKFMQLERLEHRVLLAADANPWHNAANPVDVDGSGDVSALDVLLVINELNIGGPRRLGDLIATAEGEDPARHLPMVDVNGDEFLTPADALNVINFLNNGEGEPGDFAVWLTAIEDVAIPQNFPLGPLPRPVISQVAPYESFRIEVRSQDRRADDDPNKPGVGDQFGTFAAYLDLAVREAAFSLVDDGRGVDRGTKPIGAIDPTLPVSFRNGDFFLTLGQPTRPPNSGIEYPYSNGLRGGAVVADINGQSHLVLNELGGFLNETTPPGKTPTFLYDVAFVAESIFAADDLIEVEEGSAAVDVDLLGNDELINGPQQIIIGPPSLVPESGGEPQRGSEYLAFGNTGRANEQGRSIVNPNDITFTGVTVNVVNNGTLDFLVTQQPTKGSIQRVFDGALGRDKLVYTPNANATGQDIIVYELSDGVNVQRKTATVTISISESNDPPQFNIPVNPLQLNEGDPGNLPAGSITISDSDAGNAIVQGMVTVNGGGTITLGPARSQLDFSPANGGVGDGVDDVTMTFRGTIAQINNAINGSVYNAPDVNFNGIVDIVMTVDDLGNTGTDGAKSTTETLTLNIAAVNDPPVNTVPATSAGNRLTVRSGENLIFNSQQNTVLIQDVDGNVNVSVELAITAGSGNLFVQNTAGVSVSGNNSATVTINGLRDNVNNALNGLRFSSSVIGDVTLTMTTSDLGNIGGTMANPGIDVDNIFITTIPATTPFADNDFFEVVEDSSNNMLDVLDGDITTVDLPISITHVNGNQVAVGSTASTINGGTVRNNGDSVSYTPAANFFGEDTFTYTITATPQDDLMNNGPSTGTVTVNVLGVNDGPTLNIPGDLNTTTNEETQLLLTNTVGITVADIDADLGGGTGVVVSASVSSGRLVAGASGASVVGSNTSSLTISGSVNNVNTALAGLRYTPNLDFEGNDTLQISVTDNGNTGSGTTAPATGSVGLTVIGLNDTPTVTGPSSVTTDEDETFFFTGANEVQIVDVDTSSGIFNIDLELTSAAGAPGAVAVANSGVSFTDADGSDGTLSFAGSKTQVNNALRGLRYIPTADFNGTALLQVTVDDNGSGGGGNAPTTGSRGITINVTPINDQVMAVDDDLTDTVFVGEGDSRTIFAAQVLANDSPGAANEIGQTLTVISATVPAAQGTVSVSGGQINFTASPNFTGIATITYTVQDDASQGLPANTQDSAVVSITVVAKNDAPEITAPRAVSGVENQNFVFTGDNAISITDVDAGDNDLTVSLILSHGNLGTLSLNSTSLSSLDFTVGDGVEDTSMTFHGTLMEIATALTNLTFNTAANLEGTVNMTITVNDNGHTGDPPFDGELTAMSVVNIVITGTNDPPENQVPGDQTVDEDGELIFSQVMSAATNGETTFAGPISVFDPDAGAFDISVTLSIPPNTGTLTLGTTNGIAIVDGANNSARMEIIGSMDEINVALDGLTYRPPANFNTPLFGITPVLTILTNDLGRNGQPPASGERELTDTDTINITVNPVNDDPVLNDDSMPTLLMNTVDNVFDVLANDIQTAAQGNVDGDETFTITAVEVVSTTPDDGSPNVPGMVRISNDGRTLIYTPGTDFEGTEIIEYTASDGNGGFGTALVTVRVVDFVPSDVIGKVYIDENVNGRFDQGEMGLGGVRMRLTGTDLMGEEFTLDAWTDSQGNYVFDDVLPSLEGTTYRLRQVNQPVGLLDGAESVSEVGARLTGNNDEIEFVLPKAGLTDGMHDGNHFGELGPTAAYASLGLGNLITYSDGSNGQGSDGGLVFGTNFDGTLSWFLDAGGWQGYTPGRLVSTDPQTYIATHNASSFHVTHDHDSRTELVVVPPGSGMLSSVNNTALGKITRFSGRPEDVGLVSYIEETEAASSSGGSMFGSLLSGSGGSYAAAVDGVFSGYGSLLP